jgi:hypothetical protein
VQEFLLATFVALLAFQKQFKLDKSSKFSGFKTDNELEMLMKHVLASKRKTLLKLKAFKVAQ